MRFSAHVLTLFAVAVAAGTLPFSASAHTVAPGSRPRSVARATVTEIREVVNQTSDPIWLRKEEDKSYIAVDPNSKTTGSMWVPWVGSEAEMNKSIAVSRTLTRIPYWIFQDYWNTADQIRYSSSNSYAQSTPVPGSSTGGDRKRLIIRSDGSPFMENIG